MTKFYSNYLAEIKMPQGRSQLKKDISKLSLDAPSDDLEHDTDIVSLMKDNGWSKIGSGFYALVFSHPSKDYIIKVFGNDRETLAWLEVVRKNKNPYLPKLRGKPIKIGNKVYAVRMEKLKPVTGADFDRFMDEYDYDIGDDMVALKKLLKPFVVDLHDENIMKRADGQIVVTDPVSYTSFSDLSKYKTTKDALAYMRSLK